MSFNVHEDMELQLAIMDQNEVCLTCFTLVLHKNITVTNNKLPEDESCRQRRRCGSPLIQSNCPSKQTATDCEYYKVVYVVVVAFWMC
jgi:hypothetical protein